MATTTPSRASARRDLTTKKHQHLGSLLGRVWAVDAVGIDERAASLAKRSIKREAKLWALDLAIRMMDLTTLEGKDTPGKIRALAGKARRPDPTDPSIPSVAALCVYPNMIPTAVEALKGSGVKVASVATYFPSGQAPLEVKLHDVRSAVELGADEIDMVIDRGAFLAGDYAIGLRRDHRGQGGVRRRAPQGHPRDRRAGDVRQRAARIGPGNGGRARTSSRPAPARSSPRRPCRSRSSCSRQSATSTPRPDAWSA